jgi:hypothetical protein
MTQGKISDAEWQVMYDDVTRMMEDAIRAKQDFILVSISNTNAERPNASWRRKFAELRTKNDQLPRALSVIVTSSLLLRGVMTAINWVIPAKAKEKTIAVDTFEEGLVWLRNETERPLHYLHGMHRECLAKLFTSATA